MSGRGASVRAPAAVALAAVAAVLITGIASPLLLTLLHRAGAAGATLEEVTLRVLELVAIALTFPLLAALGGGGRAAWGLPRTSGVAPRLAAGLAIGVASLAPACLLLLALGVRVARPDLDPDALWWLTIVARASVSAVVIALLEEIWFRGGLFTVAERWGGARAALWGVAAFYAAAHFLDAPHDAARGGADGAFLVMAQASAAVFRLENLDSFVALLFAGVALGLTRLRQRHVALAIGIHAGWVLTIKVFKKYTYVLPDGPLRHLAGRYDDVIGWVAAACLGLLALALWWRLAPVEAVR